MKLTARAVAALRLPEGKTDAIYFDDALPRFGYRLRKGAGDKVLRSWIVQYRHASATRRMTLGPDGVLNAEGARRKALQALGDVAHDRDPQSLKQDKRDKDKQTLRATVKEYLAAKESKSRPRTNIERTRYLTGPYFKPLHNLALDRITLKDVANRLKDIEAESTSIVAGLARAQLSGLFAWALAQSYCQANPVVGTEKPEGAKEGDRVLSDDELASIWSACGDDDYGRCIKLLILTGCRRQEIGGMRWSEFDDPKNPSKWTLPASRSKNHHALTLPWLPMMQAVIATVPGMASRDTLFGMRDGGFTSWPYGKRLLDERAGLEEAWSTHDLRRSCATRMADIGIAPHVIETILNHQSGHKRGPAGIYNKSTYEREVLAALTTWHDHVRTLVDSKVINLQENAA